MILVPIDVCAVCAIDLIINKKEGNCLKSSVYEICPHSRKLEINFVLGDGIDKDLGEG